MFSFSFIVETPIPLRFAFGIGVSTIKTDLPVCEVFWLPGSGKDLNILICLPSFSSLHVTKIHASGI
jgi:hypothetical protein